MVVNLIDCILQQAVYRLTRCYPELIILETKTDSLETLSLGLETSVLVLIPLCLGLILDLAVIS